MRDDAAVRGDEQESAGGQPRRALHDGTAAAAECRGQHIEDDTGNRYGVVDVDRRGLSGAVLIASTATMRPFSTVTT